MCEIMKNAIKKYGISLIAVTISIIALCHTCPRIIPIDKCGNADLGFDYIGAIVGILSILITVLIGWNIYTVIDVKKTKEEINDYKERTQRIINRSLLEMQMELSATSVSLIKDVIKINNGTSTEEAEVHLTINYLQLIKADLQLANTNLAEVHFRSMRKDLSNRKPIKTKVEFLGIISHLCDDVNKKASILSIPIDTKIILQYFTVV